MMLVYQKNTDLQGEGGLKIRTHKDKGEGGKWAKICSRFLWMAPYPMHLVIQCKNMLTNAKNPLSYMKIVLFSTKKCYLIQHVIQCKNVVSNAKMYCPFCP